MPYQMDSNIHQAAARKTEQMELEKKKELQALVLICTTHETNSLLSII